MLELKHALTIFDTKVAAAVYILLSESTFPLLEMYGAYHAEFYHFLLN